MSLEQIRADFPILQNGAVYLDSGATSLTPTPVVEAVTKYYTDYNANIHRGLYDWSVEATEDYEGAHKTLAAFVNAEHVEEMIFTAGTTSALNVIASMTTANMQPGEEIVTTLLEHHSNFVPWQKAAEAKGLVFKTINVQEDGCLDLEDAKQKITSKTRVVAFTAVSNALGVLTPIKELCALAHENGAIAVVDGAQHIPHFKVDVQDMGCDFYAFSGHKMYGPTGTGGFYARREHLLNMEPVVFGGDMISEVTIQASTWNELPWKFEAGTPHIAGGIGLGVAADYMTSVGLETIEQHEQNMTAYALEVFDKLDGVEVYGPTDPHKRIGVVSFGIDGMHPHDVAELLNRKHIAVRAGHHCAMPLMDHLEIPGTTRASFGIYTSKDDIDALAEAVEYTKSIFTV
ncbi:MAG: SufS family cysteine desulfurase [Candidatus Andersenbacteria bacterium]|nr:SufS family cysteine desulfurase [Candidatus Andersenbacteria bacterium]